MLLYQALLEELAVVAVDDRLLRDIARDCIRYFLQSMQFVVHLIAMIVNFTRYRMLSLGCQGVPCCISVQVIRTQEPHLSRTSRL